MIFKNSFEWVGENTFKYSNEGKEVVYDVVFETIDGMEIMTLSNRENVINLEKSSYNMLMFYFDMSIKMVNEMQGFWLVCGFEGKIDDATRSFGNAMEFEGKTITVYNYNEEILTDAPFEFIDEDSFVIKAEGEEILKHIAFETIDGISVMTLSSIEGVINLEKSSYEEMQKYVND